MNEPLADDSINESEIITRCVSLSIIHTGAFDSINSINHLKVYVIINHSRGAGDFINES